MATKLISAFLYFSLTGAASAAVDWTEVARDDHAFSLFSPSDGAMIVPGLIAVIAMIAAAIVHKFVNRGK